MTTTTTPFGPEFYQKMFTTLLNAADEGAKQAARMLWTVFTTLLAQHWQLIILAFFVVFIAVTLKAMMGRWGSLGSFLYNFFYFGTLLIIGSIWGPEVFVNDFFNAACAVLLYPACYILTGIVLDKMRVR